MITYSKRSGVHIEYMDKKCALKRGLKPSKNGGCGEGLRLRTAKRLSIVLRENLCKIIGKSPKANGGKKPNFAMQNCGFVSQ